jgi:nucleotide-binding universal stress UspA family protein
MEVCDMAAQAETLRASGGLAIHEIVAVIDEHESTRRGLAVAAPLAHHFGVPLHVVAVHPPKGSGARYSALRVSVGDSLDWLVGRYGSAGLSVDARIVVGDRTDCPICEAYPDAVVVGSVGAPQTQVDLLPLIGEDLARHAPHDPVIVAGPGVVDEWHPGPIGVALDGSTLAEAALAIATRWATAFGTSLEIVQVVPSSTHEHSDAVCSEYLRAIQRDLRMKGVAASCRTVVGDDTAGAITRHLRDRRCALAILATHGFRSRRDGLGRVAMSVVAQSPCPVHIARPFASTATPWTEALR